MAVLRSTRGGTALTSAGLTAWYLVMTLIGPRGLPPGMTWADRRYEHTRRRLALLCCPRQSLSARSRGNIAREVVDKPEPALHRKALEMDEATASHRFMVSDLCGLLLENKPPFHHPLPPLSLIPGRPSSLPLLYQASFQQRAQYRAGASTENLVNASFRRVTANEPGIPRSRDWRRSCRPRRGVVYRSTQQAPRSQEPMGALRGYQPGKANG